VRSRLNGKQLQRVEIDNQGATIDLLVLPLINGEDKTGAIVLLAKCYRIAPSRPRAGGKGCNYPRDSPSCEKQSSDSFSAASLAIYAVLKIQQRQLALDEAVRRIASIAVVHETLSNSTQTTVAFDEVLLHW